MFHILNHPFQLKTKMIESLKYFLCLCQYNDLDGGLAGLVKLTVIVPWLLLIKIKNKMYLGLYMNVSYRRDCSCPKIHIKACFQLLLTFYE